MVGDKSEKKIYFVVVIYNKDCHDSPSVCYAINHKELYETIVVDNSTLDNDNKLFCEKNNIKYISMNGNAGLSKAYNCVLSGIKDDQGYVVWADDDTLFPDNYVEDMVSEMNEKGYDIGLPLVLANEAVYSPVSVDKYGLPKRIKDVNELGKEISGINSGMMVNIMLYRKYKYDEKMFLDFIDHDICKTCNASGGSVGFIPHVVIHQNSFFSSRLHIKSLKNRRQIYKKDFSIYCKKHGIDCRIAKKKLVHGDIALAARIIKQLFR